MLCKIYDQHSSNNSVVKELYDESSNPLIMPSVQLEDINGREIFLYDVLLDNEGEGWVVYFHEKGYICLVRIGSTLNEQPVAVMNLLKDFGDHYYKLPMKVVGNKYIDRIEDSCATPDRCKFEFRTYLEKHNYVF